MSMSETQRPAHLFQPGQVANPTGMTRTRERARHLIAEFHRLRGRRPNIVEETQLQGAAALGAKLASGRLSVDDAVRAAAELRRTLVELGFGFVALKSTPITAEERARARLEGRQP